MESRFEPMQVNSLSAQIHSNPSWFVRGELAWLSYFMIATYCYIASALGPSMIFLREELGLNYSTAALHFSFWSLGVVLAGFIGDKCMRRFGKFKTVWFAVSGICLAVILIITAGHPAQSVAAAFLAGACGSTMSQALCTLMADRFAELRAVALSEANIAASICCCFAPLAVSFATRVNLGWRAAFLLPVLAYVLYFIFARRVLSSEESTKSALGSVDSSKLPPAYFLCCVLVFLSVASEWSIIYWSSDFLKRVIGLSKSDAAAGVTAFLIAMVLGRLLGSRFAGFVQTRSLLKVASIVALSGFLVFWLNKALLLCYSGLFLAGLGISNFYPLILSMAIGLVPGNPARATARLSLASGSSTLIAPLMLGLLAEKYGIFQSYGFIAALLVLCGLLVYLPVWGQNKNAVASAALSEPA